MNIFWLCVFLLGSGVGLLGMGEFGVVEVVGYSVVMSVVVMMVVVWLFFVVDVGGIYVCIGLVSCVVGEV